MIKAIFFDFDGTISDAKSLVHKAFVDLFKKWGFKISEKQIRSLMGEKVRKILQEIGVKGLKVERVRKVLYDIIFMELEKRKLKPCANLKPLYGLGENYPLIVVSNSDEAFLVSSINNLEIGDLFDEIVGAHKSKNKDKLLRALFRKYKIKPHEAIYVGDRFSDVEYARVAGCWAVAIHNNCSWSTLKEIKAEKPDFIISNFSDLKKVVGKIDKSKSA
jgi:HAD superfamily hydrolase (TIGR01549 family)